MDNEQNQKFVQMTTQPVEKLICKFAVPTIISMLVTTFYNMADTFFVGKLENVSATGAVGVAFSLMSIIQALGFFFGQGSGNFISRELGKQHVDNSSRMAAIGFFSAILLGGVVAVGGLVFLTPLCRLLGATETILPYARSYLTYILLTAPIMCGSLVLNNQLRFQGNALYSMVGITSGAVVNIALDPLFIFVFNMGIAGAALATAISQCASFILLLIGMSRSNAIKIRLGNFKPAFAVYKELFRGGTPSLARQGLASIAIATLNGIAGSFGDAAVAAMSIVSRFMGFLSSVVIGFGQGYQPVCGFNYGAGLYRRVYRAFWFSVLTTFLLLTVVSVGCFPFTSNIVSFIQCESAEAINIGAEAMRFQLMTMPLMSFVVISNMTLQTVGQTILATIIAAARQGLTFVPAVLILPRLFGLTGLELVQPTADLLSFAITIPIALFFLRKLKKNGDRPSGLPLDTQT